MQKVLYWQDVLGNSEDLNQYQGIISKLLNGDYKEGDLEKLAGHNVYSVRVNKSDRLLFSTVTVKGKSCLLLLDVVLNHDYHKSRFLKPQVLRQFLEQNVLKALAKEELAFVKADALPPLWANPKSKEEEETIEYQKVTFYNQTFITLSDAQEKALKTQLPAVISGAAGSGKSCVALAILEQAVTQFIYAPEKPLLYITQSANLAQTLQRMWEQLPASQTEAGKQVQFLTYQQFIEQQAKELKDKKAQDKASFMTWLNHYIGSYNNKAKAAKKILAKEFQEFLKNTESIYQAFRYLSGFLPENPQGISARHDQFKNDHERQWLIEAYANYKKSHDDEKNTGFNPEFHTLKQQNLYDLIVVDEAQDLSGLQLKNLRRAAQNGQIAYCMDSNQSLIDPVSQRPLLVSEGANHIELPVTYRCPGHVVKVANAILDLKQRVTGGLADKLEYSRIILSDEQINNPGIVEWIEPNELNKHPHLKQLAQTTQFAVVTLSQFKEKAKELFGTPLVFTPEEIKGLEYPHIVLYRLFDDPVFGKANKIITPITTKTEPHRAKAGQGDESFAPPFNQVFTACTRPTESLTFVEDSSANRLDNSAHQLNNIIPPIKQLIKNLNNPNNNNNNNSIDHKTTAPASAQDWNNEAIRLRQLGKIEQANAIEKQIAKPLVAVVSGTEAKSAASAAAKRATRKASLKDNKKNPAPTKTAEELVTALIEEKPLTTTEIRQFIDPERINELWWNTTYKGHRLFILLFLSLFQKRKITQFFESSDLNNIAKTILTYDRLMEPIKDGNEKTVLLYMCANSGGAQYLHQIFENNPKLLERCLPHLYTRQAIRSKNGEVAMVSPLFYLTINYPELCLMLTGKNFIKRIPVETWYQEGTVKGYCQDLPLLVALITTLWYTKEHKQTIAAILGALTPRLVDAGFPDALLCKEGILLKSEDSVSISLLQALLLLSEGIDLLWKLMSNSPKSFAQIPPEIWLNNKFFKGEIKPSDSDDSISNQSQYYTLLDSLAFCHHTGMPILDKLLDLYPDLPYIMPAKMLYKKYDESGISLLHFLVAQSTAIPPVFLFRMLHKNPALTKDIPLETWYASPHQGVIPPLYWLCHSQKGLEIIACVMKECPNLLEVVPIEFWNHPLTVMINKQQTNNSPLDLLLRHDADWDLVYQIAKTAGKDRFSQWALKNKRLALLLPHFFPENEVAPPPIAAMQSQASPLFFSPATTKENNPSSASKVTTMEPE